MLRSFARFQAFRVYTNLRVYSSYSGVGVEEYLIQKRESVCSLNEFCRISERTLFFINYSDRAKYKRKATFSVLTKKFVDLRFSRKFCREVDIDVRSNVKSWIEQNSFIVKYMWTLYNNPKTKYLIFDEYNINKVKKLLTDYNYTQSLLVIKSLAKLQTRIVQQNIPYNIKKLQCIFFESFPVTILAVYNISQSFAANSPGVDGKFFKTVDNRKTEFRQKRLEEVKFKKFSKTYRIKKIVLSENVG
jgi:hypothetical protein